MEKVQEISLKEYNLKSNLGRAMLRLDLAGKARAEGRSSDASLSELQAIGEILNDPALRKVRAGELDAITEKLPDDLKAPIKARIQAVKAKE